jgi:hypothetical protein
MRNYMVLIMKNSEKSFMKVLQKIVHVSAEVQAQKRSGTGTGTGTGTGN